MSGKLIFDEKFRAALRDVPKGAVGVAVSGGGDSIALLRLLRDWGQYNDRKIYAATVNHNLRSEAQAEAEYVAALCAELNVPHTILNWVDWNGQGNLQNAARNARKNLLTAWARNLDLMAIALGHTQDDQAETFLMRLARGSGVDGLSGMQQYSGKEPIWIRPLLDISRADLRGYLSSLDQDWIDDPSNDDDRFDRVKMRKALPVLAELGLTSERLASTASGLQSSRAALEYATQQAAYKYCLPDEFGSVTINLEKLQSEPLDIQYRILSHAIGWVTGAPYRPRFSALKTVYELLRQGKSQTLAGCYIKVNSGKQIIVMRELAGLLIRSVQIDCYDSRWRITAEHTLTDAMIGPLGEKGLQQLANWRDLGVLRDILLQTPAVWQDETVVSTVLDGYKGPVQISLKADAKQFYEGIVSH